MNLSPSPLRARFQPVGLTGRRVGSYEPEAFPSPLEGEGRGEGVISMAFKCLKKFNG